MNVFLPRTWFVMCDRTQYPYARDSSTPSGLTCAVTHNASSSRRLQAGLIGGNMAVACSQT